MVPQGSVARGAQIPSGRADSVVASRLVYLLGAGASVPAGLPTAMGLTNSATQAANALGGLDLYQHGRSLNFVLAAMRLHDVRTNEDAPPVIGIERLVSAVELLAHRSELEVAPFIQNWDPLVDALELGDSSSSSATRSFARSVSSASVLPGRRRDSALNQAAVQLEQAIRDLARPITTPSFRYLHTWLTRRLVMDLVVSDESRTSYLTSLLQAAQDEDAVITTLNYDLTVEICARTTGIPVNRMINNWSNTGALDEDGDGIPYLKLHGSVDWTTTDGDDLQVGGQGESQRIPALVYGQREKLRSTGPFLQLLESFRRRLASADRLIVSGYSFGDEHVNAIIRRWMLTKPDGKLLVVDPGFPDLYGYGVPQLDLWHQFGAGEKRPVRTFNSGPTRTEVERYVPAAKRMFVRREGIAEFAALLEKGSKGLFVDAGLSPRERDTIRRKTSVDR